MQTNRIRGMSDMTKTLEDVVGMKVNKQLRKGVVKRTGVIQEVPEGNR
ncbi:hypothetical protein JL_197 [Bacillus phage JL]|uniref:Uncharacterized protein n=1 Tax=Bacillus phage JL TaxID=1296655 RepID=S5M4W0_9CAUD|nr:hypothetical protein AVV47_gp099 [Bacillus phage JL]AGR46921.1 hypothetical protein JL_197 [Bacillus phage JL]